MRFTTLLVCLFALSLVLCVESGQPQSCDVSTLSYDQCVEKPSSSYTEWLSSVALSLLSNTVLSLLQLCFLPIRFLMYIAARESLRFLTYQASLLSFFALFLSTSLLGATSVLNLDIPYVISILLVLMVFVLDYLLKGWFMSGFISISGFGAPLFLFLQTIVLAEFGYKWNSSWVARDEPSYYILLSLASILTLIPVFTVSGTLLLQQGGLVIGLSVFSMLAVLVVSSSRMSNHGNLLTSSVVVLYATYLLHAALSGTALVGGIVFAMISVTFSTIDLISQDSIPPLCIYVGLASMYATAILTQWELSTPYMEHIGSLFTGMALYSWTLVAPTIFPDRDFGRM